MAGTGPLDLHALAVEFLDACVEALDTIPSASVNALAGAPIRRFVAPGPVALDCCDQLAVYVAPIDERTGIGGHGHINQVEFVVVASRCVPSPDEMMNPPPATEIQEAAEQINADKWALWNHLHNMVREGLLFETCCGVEWLSLEPLTPGGGCGGSMLTLNVCVDGYESVLGT